MRWLESITDSVDRGEQTLGDGDGQGSLASCRASMGLQRVGHDLVTEQN